LELEAKLHHQLEMWKLVDALIKEMARQRESRKFQLWNGDAVLMTFRQQLLNSRVEMREMLGLTYSSTLCNEHGTHAGYSYP
jgi:hypothetical protein